jgi:phosphate starvation-inducible PhoH-like protein
MEQLIRFRDDDEVMRILGVQDRNLRTLRELYGVQAVARGRALELRGEEEAVGKARALVESMLMSVRDGGPSPELLLADAERARHSASEAIEAHPSLSDDPPAVVASPTAQGSAPSTAKSRLGGEEGELDLTTLSRTPGQIPYLEALQNSPIVLAIGPAGTGKTYLAVRMAVEALKRGDVRKLILCRPAVEAGEKLGFLPGDFHAKVNPYLRPLYDALGEILDYDQVRRYSEREIIEVVPLAYMRGRTLNKAYIILDEAQNTTAAQMKMFLTRMGHESRIVITGDITQIDLPQGTASGLIHARRILRRINGITWVELGREDIVRNPLVSQIVEAYDRHEAGEGQAGGKPGRTEARSSSG